MIIIAGQIWLGHIARKTDNVLCMKITFSQSEGSRKKQRPRIRRLDLVLKTPGPWK
jgi:hypothetical protein